MLGDPVLALPRGDHQGEMKTASLEQTSDLPVSAASSSCLLFALVSHQLNLGDQPTFCVLSTYCPIPSSRPIPTSCPHLTTLTLLPHPGPVPLPPTLPSRGQADAREGEDQSRTMCDCWTKALSFSCTRQGDEANGEEDKLTPKKRGP